MTGALAPVGIVIVGSSLRMERVEKSPFRQTRTLGQTVEAGSASAGLRETVPPVGRSTSRTMDTCREAPMETGGRVYAVTENPITIAR